MLNNKADISQRNVVIKPSELIAYFGQEDSGSLVLELPSVEQLREFRGDISRFTKISLSNLAADDRYSENKLQAYKCMLERLDRNEEKYDESSTYQVHRSNLLKAIGEDQEAVNSLLRATKYDSRSYLRNILGDIYILNNENEKAKELFGSEELSNDLYSLVRMAYFRVLDGDFDDAQSYINKALEIDNTDYNSRMFDGVLKLHTQEWELAVRSFRVALEENNTSSVLHTNLAIAYWQLNETDKTISVLKKAIQKNPFNIQAISFFADVMHIEERDSESLDILRHYLQHEQKSVSIWGRLSRALYIVGKVDNRSDLLLEALQALRHLESLESDSSVWNNIGLVYWALDKPQKAVNYFGQSMKEASNPDEHTLPVYNLAGLLIEKGMYKKCNALISSYLDSNVPKNVDNVLFYRVKFQYVITMQALDLHDDAARYCEEIIADNHTPLDTRVDILNQLIYFESVINNDKEASLPYVDMLINYLDNEENISSEAILRSKNHIVFYYLSFGEINEAEKILLPMSNYIHKDPFLTATLGMYHITKGNVERGKELYSKAISMVSDQKLKRRIKQRMHYEIGKELLALDDVRNAKKQLEKAMHMKDGFNYVNTQIRNYLNKLKPTIIK